jgi:hypothetical protein
MDLNADNSTRSTMYAPSTSMAPSSGRFFSSSRASTEYRTSRDQNHHNTSSDVGESNSLQDHTDQNGTQAANRPTHFVPSSRQSSISFYTMDRHGSVQATHQGIHGVGSVDVVKPFGEEGTPSIHPLQGTHTKTLRKRSKITNQYYFAPNQTQNTLRRQTLMSQTLPTRLLPPCSKRRDRDSSVLAAKLTENSTSLWLLPK